MSYFTMFSILCACLFTGCAGPTITVKQGYDFGKIQRVAMINLKDYPKAPGSGEMVSGIFEKYLLEAGYQIVERDQVTKILQEQSLSLTGAIDSKTAKDVGKILGVDALIMGNVTSYSVQQEKTTYVDLGPDNEPVVRTREVRVKRGSLWVTETKTEVVGYRRRRQRVPQTNITPARVAVSLRMVDVQTGQILWVASSSKESDTPEDAAENLCRHILRVLKKTFPKNGLQNRPQKG